MDYTIIKFDEATAQVVLRFGDGRAYPDVAVDLPVDDSGNVPTGDELTTYLSGFVPTYFVERAAKIQEHGIPNKEDVKSLVTDAPEVIFEDDADKASYYREDRDEELAASDWAVLPDSPLSETEQTAWRDFRQYLRNMPEQAGWPDSFVKIQKPMDSMATGTADDETLARFYIDRIMPASPTKYLEVGVEAGDTMIHVAETHDSLEAVDGVDPYTEFTNTLSNEGNPVIFLGSTMALWKEAVIRNMAASSASDKITMDYRSGADAVSSFTDEDYDVIFLNHEMEPGVYKADVKSYWAKLKSGGKVCGMFYNLDAVKQEVDSAITELGLNAADIQVDGKFWYMTKA